MNRESPVVTPIRKHSSFKKQFQKRLDKANAKVFELEKKLREANLKNVQLEKQLKVLKQAGWNDKKDLQIKFKQINSDKKIKKNLPSKHLLVFKASWRRLQDMSWGHLQHDFSVTLFHLPRRLENVFKTSWRHLGRQKIVTLNTSWRRLGDKQNVC